MTDLHGAIKGRLRGRFPWLIAPFRADATGNLYKTHRVWERLGCLDLGPQRRVLTQYVGFGPSLGEIASAASPVSRRGV